jgi:hypothetical protein
VTIRLLIFSLFVPSLLAFGQQSSGEKPAASLESAQRDLKELPTLKRSGDLLDKGKAAGKSSLPSADALTDQAALTSKPQGTPTQELWLMEALLKDEKARALTSGGRNDVPKTDKQQGPDLFSKYMEQWLSPGDRTLLYPSSRRTDERVVTEPLPNRTLEKPFDATQAQQPGDVLHLMGKANPYIDEPEPFPSPALASPQKPANPALSLLSPATSTVTTTSPTPVTITPVQPASSAQQPPKPPTAPIVDDRKYFPQLRRF